MCFFTSFFFCYCRCCCLQPNKESEYYLETINKIISVGITDDLFTKTQKGQIIDDYNEWIKMNKNHEKLDESRYVLYIYFDLMIWVYLF